MKTPEELAAQLAERVTDTRTLECLIFELSRKEEFCDRMIMQLPMILFWKNDLQKKKLNKASNAIHMLMPSPVPTDRDENFCVHHIDTMRTIFPDGTSDGGSEVMIDFYNAYVETLKETPELVHSYWATDVVVCDEYLRLLLLKNK